ncbi:MAG: penicillin-binding protein 2 [Scytolyngbya sp. HA4215-MV1]|nr:penicillin-binding protein 2 [Scytolyngbya sp. HA4215-MV1]
MASGLTFSPGNRLVNTVLTQRSRQAIALMFITTSLLSVCAFRLAQLQLIQGQHHRQLADQNRIRLIPVAADRGNILDRHGKVLAANRLTRSVYLWPRKQSPEQWQITAGRLSRILGIPSHEIIQKLEQVNYDSPSPVRISRDIRPEAFVALAEEASQFPGIEIFGESSRYYPHKELAAHLIGYLGEATQEDLKKNPNYPMGIQLGQMGIERLAEQQIQGKWGNRLVEVDVNGKESRWLGVKPPESGSSVQLTINLDLQQAAEKGLKNRRGAAVVLDVKTGAVLALASSPSFDPNLFTRRISQAEWRKLQNADDPFLNRALQGYPPASTFKIVTTAAGIESGKFTPDSTLATSAFISLGGVQFHEHGGGGYGVIGFRDAIAYSSNTFFYQVGLATGPEQIAKWGHRLGIGETPDLGIGGGSHGSIPTPAQKEKLYGEPWYGGDTVSMAIGQGLVQVTPLELAVMVSAIANGGWRVRPHLMASQTNTSETQRIATGLKPSTLAVIRGGLEAVVKDGTGRQLGDGSIPLTAGKTGTAEVPGGRETNALFVGYGPAKKPEIALAIVVENGGYGAVAAVPIAHEIYKAYFKQHR